jgi:hypothetical protein
MRSLIFGLLLFISFKSSLFAKTLIVSDVDDTIKVTDVLDKMNAVYNSMFTKIEFSGMSVLYKELDTSENIFYYVSGSPILISEKVNEFLTFNNFPQRENLILKNSMSDSTYSYKINAIEQLINKIKPDHLILIGDDTELDPEIYSAISKKFPAKVDSIYIHAIKARALPELKILKNYFAATEIAGWEVIKGNLNSESIIKVANSFDDGGNGSQVVIPLRYCPFEGRSQIEEIKLKLLTPLAIEALELTQQKIIATCN